MSFLVRKDLLTLERTKKGFMGKRILLVDDEADILTLYKKILERGGYEISTAQSGNEAFEKMVTFKPHLVILDIMMPGMDGWEVAKKIRADDKEKDIPIIMLTVKSMIEDKVKSIEVAGANRHLTKPVDSHNLLYTVKSLLHEV
jgi:CheY-like chemotaxis protein